MATSSRTKAFYHLLTKYLLPIHPSEWLPACTPVLQVDLHNRHRRQVPTFRNQHMLVLLCRAAHLAAEWECTRVWQELGLLDMGKVKLFLQPFQSCLFRVEVQF